MWLFKFIFREIHIERYSDLLTSQRLVLAKIKKTLVKFLTQLIFLGYFFTILMSTLHNSRSPIRKHKLINLLFHKQFLLSQFFTKKLKSIKEHTALYVDALLDLLFLADEFKLSFCNRTCALRMVLVGVVYPFLMLVRVSQSIMLPSRAPVRKTSKE